MIVGLQLQRGAKRRSGIFCKLHVDALKEGENRRKQEEDIQ